MMRLRVETVGEGLHPDERIVKIVTDSGNQQLCVDKEVILNSTLSIGWPVGQKENGRVVLVELPSETESGDWRVWVDRNELSSDEKVLKRA